MNPASLEAMIQAQQAQQAQPQGQPSQGQPPPAQKWPGEAGDAPQDDPAYEQIQSGIYDMSPEELDALSQMIDEARARLVKGDKGGDIKL